MERERIDDLGINGYQIIQKEQGFCFGMDAVLLSDFAQVKNGGRVLDLGTAKRLPRFNIKGRNFDGGKDEGRSSYRA